MHACRVVGFVVFGAAWVTCARADLVVTLEAKDAQMNPIAGDVTAGSQVIVDILLSVDGDDNPLADLRGIQLDFAATSSCIQLESFTWEVDSGAYGFQVDQLPMPSATSLMLSSGPGLLSLSEEPLFVAAVEVTVDASGTLNALGSLDLGQSGFGSFNAGFGWNGRRLRRRWRAKRGRRFPFGSR